MCDRCRALRIAICAKVKYDWMLVDVQDFEQFPTRSLGQIAKAKTSSDQMMSAGLIRVER
jgi:hypothetical protein